MTWAHDIKRLYDLTVEEYDDILRFQGGRCAGCLKKPRGRAHLPVDHDHRSGLIRGLLCGRCNYDLLGHFGEDPTYYRRIAEYLENSPAKFAIGYRYTPDAPPREAS